jgi:hypothetical protein
LTLHLGPHCTSGDYDRWFGGLVQVGGCLSLFVGLLSLAELELCIV